MALVVEALDGRLLAGPVHPLDSPIVQRVVWLGEPVFDVVYPTDHVEAHLTRPSGVAAARLLGEPDAIGDQDRVDAVGEKSGRLVGLSDARL